MGGCATIVLAAVGLLVLGLHARTAWHDPDTGERDLPRGIVILVNHVGLSSLFEVTLQETLGSSPAPLVVAMSRVVVGLVHSSG